VLLFDRLVDCFSLDFCVPAQLPVLVYSMFENIQAADLCKEHNVWLILDNT
jgi:hypothetical protein